MQRKLQCILVDDDLSIHHVFRDYLKDCEYGEMVEYYIDPRDFIRENKKPDIVFIDIVLPHIDGFTLATSIKPTPVILFTNRADYFSDIMNLIEPLDVFPKPIVKERLLKSLKHASILLNHNNSEKKYELFNTDEGKINILLSDILFVKTIKNSHRFLEIYLKGGRKYIVKGYSLEYIHKIAGFLIQSNRAELVSPDAVDIVTESNSVIKLRGINENNKPIQSALCYSFRKEFLGQLNSI